MADPKEFLRVSDDDSLTSYTVATVPSATAKGQLIYVSDAIGAHVTGSIAFSNALGVGSWIDVTTGVAVVSS